MRHFFYMIAYDIRFSFWKNRSKWVVAFLIQVYLCIRIFHEISWYDSPYDFFSELWMLMRGESDNQLTIRSSYWVLFHGYLCFLIGFYPVNEWYLGNGQTSIRSYSRKRWLFSKLISVAVNVIVYYGGMIGFMLLRNLFYGGTILPESGVLAVGIPIYNQSMIELWLFFLILPFLVSLALGELQVCLSFWVNPVFAFMINVAYLIAAIFIPSPSLLGNFAMLYRQNWVSGNQAIDWDIGILLCTLLLIATIVIGLVLFEKKDILPEQ